MIKVAVGILLRNGTATKSPDILLCQRKVSARYGLKWEFPGGKVEPDEQAEAGLRRELQEELGISAEVGEIYHQQHYIYPDSGSFDVVYYRIPSFNGEMVNLVFETYRWVPVAELERYDILEGNRDVVSKLKSEYGQAAPKQN